MADLTAGRIPKANGPTIIGDSSIVDTGARVDFHSTGGVPIASLYSTVPAGTDAEFDVQNAGGQGAYIYVDSSTASFGAFGNVPLSLTMNLGPVLTVDTDGRVTVTTGPFGIPTSTPASAAAAGVAGTIAWDASFIYVCTATNTWKRVAIATW